MAEERGECADGGGRRRGPAFREPAGLVRGVASAPHLTGNHLRISGKEAVPRHSGWEFPPWASAVSSKSCTIRRMTAGSHLRRTSTRPPECQFLEGKICDPSATEPLAPRSVLDNYELLKKYLPSGIKVGKITACRGSSWQIPKESDALRVEGIQSRSRSLPGGVVRESCLGEEALSQRPGE